LFAYCFVDFVPEEGRCFFNPRSLRRMLPLSSTDYVASDEGKLGFAAMASA
jgi:hypothetical protein